MDMTWLHLNDTAFCFISPFTQKAKYQIIKLMLEITAPIKIYPLEIWLQISRNPSQGKSLLQPEEQGEAGGSAKGMLLISMF